MQETQYSGVLAEMTVDEVLDFRPEVVVLPLGSTEPHGPHLPLGTDNFQVDMLTRRAVGMANERGARALLYPVLPITNNANMRRIPFALRMGVRTLMQVLIDIAEQCYEDEIRKMVIVNGHGGNPATIDAALREIAGMDRMPFICATMGFTLGDFVDPIEHPSDHAGESETSRMLAIRPDLVKKDKLTQHPFGQLAAPLVGRTQFVRPWHMYMPNTAGGETRAASAEKGESLLNAKAEGIAALLVQLTEAAYTEGFPYREE